MLHNLQREFVCAIYHDGSAILDSIDNTRRDARRQIEIYQNSVHGNLLNTLSEIYPVSKKLVGNEFFDAMCMRYIRRTPSESPDINDYGKTLPEFTGGFKPAESLVYLPDVMRLEWAWHSAYQADEIIYKELGTLLTLPLDTLLGVQLELIPTSTLLHSDYPVHRIWQLNQDDNADEQISLDEGECYLFIWRKQLDMRIDILSKSMYSFLESLRVNQNLASILEHSDNFEQNLSSALGLGYIRSYQITY